MASRLFDGPISVALFALLLASAPGPSSAGDVALQLDSEGRLTTPVPVIRKNDRVVIRVASPRAEDGEAAPVFRLDCREYRDPVAASSPGSYLRRAEAEGVELRMEGPWEEGGVLVFDLRRKIGPDDAAALRGRLSEIKGREMRLSALPAMKVQELSQLLEEQMGAVEEQREEAAAARESLQAFSAKLQRVESEIAWTLKTMDAIVERKAMEDAERTLRDLEILRDTIRSDVLKAQETLEAAQAALDRAAAILARAREQRTLLLEAEPWLPMGREGLAGELSYLREERRRTERVLAVVEKGAGAEEHLHHGRILLGGRNRAVSHAVDGMMLAEMPMVRPEDRVTVYVVNVPASHPGNFLLTVDAVEKAGPEEVVYREAGLAEPRDPTDSGFDPGPRYREVILPVPRFSQGGQIVQYTIRDRARPEGSVHGEKTYMALGSSSYPVRNSYRLALTYGMAISSMEDRSFSVERAGTGEYAVFETTEARLLPLLSVTVYPKGRVFSGKRSASDRLLPSPMVAFVPGDFEDHLLFGADWEPLRGLHLLAGGHLLRDEAIDPDRLQEMEGALSASSDPPVDRDLRLGLFFGVSFNAGVLGAKSVSLF